MAVAQLFDSHRILVCERRLACFLDEKQQFGSNGGAAAESMIAALALQDDEDIVESRAEKAAKLKDAHMTQTLQQKERETTLRRTHQTKFPSQMRTPPLASVNP